MFSKCVFLALVASAWARTTTGPTHNQIQDDAAAGRSSSDHLSYFGDLRYVYKVYQECSTKDLTSCLKLKLVAAMERAARTYAELPLFEGVTFVKDPQASAPLMAEMKTEAEIEAALPRSLNEREDALNDLIADKVTNFFDTHSLQVKLPTTSELQRSFNGEERGKKKKSSGLLLLPLILGGTLIPLALGALALLAGKALIVSKLALVLAGIIGLKKLLSSGHSSGHDAGHEVVVSGGHGSSGWGRAYNKEQAQNMAYSAYTPNKAR